MKVNTAGLFSLAHAAPKPVVGEEPSVEVPIEVVAEPAPRMRKTTLENFNEEMAVLDRPLEGEVEFFDEPRPHRWRVPAVGMAIFALSCGAYLGVLRHRNSANPASATSAAPAPVAALAVGSTPPAPAPSAAAAAPGPDVPAAAAPSEAAEAAPVAPTPSSTLADDESRSDGRHHHHGRHGSEHHHHHHHGGHGYHARA
jgi:hypothetical protein